MELATRDVEDSDEGVFDFRIIDVVDPDVVDVRADDYKCFLGEVSKCDGRLNARAYPFTCNDNRISWIKKGIWIQFLVCGNKTISEPNDLFAKRKQVGSDAVDIPFDRNAVLLPGLDAERIIEVHNDVCVRAVEFDGSDESELVVSFAQEMGLDFPIFALL
jgi:hypothetical protein